MNWRALPYKRIGRSNNISQEILDAAVASGNAVLAVNSALPPIFTLNHLAYLTGVDYPFIRRIVEKVGDEPYRVFRVRKRNSGGSSVRFRVICTPNPKLLIVQRWIARNVLNNALMKVHQSSAAYAPSSSILDAASPHCACKWLIKLDICNFFESISEISVYRAFRDLGYQPLIAFEMARLCTRLGGETIRRRTHEQWLSTHTYKYKINAYRNHRIGHLPQGAPTSPMLSNIVMYKVDEEITKTAHNMGIVYTRYADDLIFSTKSTNYDRESAASLIRDIYKILGRYGFSPNLAKTKVVSPRSRKLVLGLLVDKEVPRLSRDFKNSMRMHLYYLKSDKIGPSKHALARGFSAVAGLRNHLFGMAAYAMQVEVEYGKWLLDELNSISWPCL